MKKKKNWLTPQLNSLSGNETNAGTTPGREGNTFTTPFGSHFSEHS